jgi:hypothetical protein
MSLTPARRAFSGTRSPQFIVYIDGKRKAKCSTEEAALNLLCGVKPGQRFVIRDRSGKLIHDLYKKDFS